MILSFNPVFQEPIEKGTKIHSIRADPTKRWKSGRMINMATGIRTKHYKQFGYLPCLNVQEVAIWKETKGGMFHVAILIDDRFLEDHEKLELANNDGFQDVVQFIQWFIPKPDGKFTGRLIHWTAKMY